jgi:hypothetical protein
MSFRAEQADFFFRFRSCENVGLRSRGISLRSSLNTWAAEVGATQIRLKVVESNRRARRFYERAGFRATGHKGVVQKSGDIEMEMACDVFPCDQ